MGPKPTGDIRNIAIRELFSDEEFMNRVLNKINDKLIELQAAVNHNMEITKKLEGQIDHLQQTEKNNNICVYNFPERDNENIRQSFSEFCQNKLNIKMNNENIVKCFRMGNAKKGPRPIIIKFEQHYFKKNILRSVGKLKGTGIGIMEDLVKNRLSLYKRAQEKLDRKNVFTRYGSIFGKKDGRILRIISGDDLNTL